jgi:polysaccharide biosynthesis/export protein
MKHSIILLVAVVVSLANPAPGQSTAVGATTGTSSPSTSVAPAAGVAGIQQRNPRYRLRKGDTFDLDFELSPEFNQTVAVQPDGYVSLKGVGSIFVEGQTVPELTETVKTAYGKTLHDPVIAIALKNFEMPYFIASGQVGKPGKYDLRSDLTVTEAVAVAGGFNDKAKHSQVVLFRPVAGGGYEAKLLNVKKLLATRNLTEDIHMQPGDMLYVPQNALSKIRPFIPNSSVGAYYSPGFN